TGTSGQGRRIKSTTHQNTHTVCSQPVRYNAIQQFVELLDAFGRSRVVDGGTRGQYPIAAKRDCVFVTDKDVCRRQPLDVGERGRSEERRVGKECRCRWSRYD